MNLTSSKNSLNEEMRLKRVLNDWIVTIRFAPALFIFMIELIPQEVRDSVSGFVLTANSLANFVIIHSYFRMKEDLGEAGLFCFYGSVCIIAAVYCRLVLPETKGKTFEEIDAECRQGDTK